MSRLSVVMACYNAMPFLPAAVASIQNQSFQDWKLIIVDDGSSDDSAEWLAEAVLQDDRLRVLSQQNAGQHVAANRAIATSTSTYIARMDADDVATPDRLAKQVAFLETHPEVGLVGGQIQRLGAKRSGLESNFPLTHESIVSSLMRNHHSMCNPTVMFRRELFNQLGGYWEHNIAEDWDLFLRMAEISQLANLPEVLLSYRFHTGSINGRRIVEAQLFNEYAAESAKRRGAGEPSLSMDEFRSSHRSNRWPLSWMFYSDSQSIGQYREAIAEIYDGRNMVGYPRLALAAAMSPNRAIRRLQNMLLGRLKSFSS